MELSVDPAQLTVSLTACPDCGIIHIPDCASTRKANQVMCYFLADEILDRVTFYLDEGYHFRDKYGLLLDNMDKVILAIRENRFPPLPAWCKPVEEVLCTQSVSI